MSVRRSGALLAICLLLVGIAGIAAASAQPTPLCSACGDSFADEVGRNVTVEHSTATIAVHGNGSATWTVRNRFASAERAEAVATDLPGVREIGDGELRDASLLERRLDGERTLVLRLRDPNFARPSVAGSLASGAFTADLGHPRIDGLGADRLTVVAPPGTAVGWRARGATVSDDGRRMTLTRLGRDSFVTFVPEESILAPLAGSIAAGALALPRALENWLPAIPLQAGAFGLLAALLGSVLAGRLPAKRVRRAAPYALGVVGTLAVADGTVPGVDATPQWWSTPVGLGVGIGALSFAAVVYLRSGSTDLEYRTLAAAAVGSVALAGVVAFASAAAAGTPSPARAGLWLAVSATSLLGFVPAGFAAARGRRPLAAAIAALVIAVALTRGVSLHPVQFGFVILAPFGAILAAGLTLVGSPLVLVGSAVGATADE